MVTVWWSAAWLIHYSFLNPNHYVWEACSANRWDAPKTSTPAASICQHVCLSLSHVSLGPLGTHQAPLPTEFSRQEYWSGLPLVNRRGPIVLHDNAQPHNAQSHSQRFRSWKNWAMKFCLILHIHLNSCQSAITSSSISTTFCRENVSTISRRQRMLSKSSSNPKAQSFKL